MGRPEATKTHVRIPSVKGKEAASKLSGTVVMIVANIKQFRFAFYEQLERELQSCGITLRVIYSESAPSEQSKGDSRDLPAPLGIKTSRSYLLRERVLFQYLPVSLLWRADLVVMVQSNGYLANFALHLARCIGWRRLAYWGHGYNHQGRETSIAEKMKRSLARHVDWWFTYTGQTGKYLQELGFPGEKMTVIENAIDTSRFALEVTGVSPLTLNALRARLHIPENGCVAIYCGSLYEDKQLGFLLDVARNLHEAAPSFRLIIIGDGPQREWLSSAIEGQPWVHYGGAQFGEDKAAYFALSNFFLNPGLVGLAILDSFAAGLPFITSQYKGHSPEICYLEHKFNGLMLPFERQAYAQAVLAMINNPAFLLTLREGALNSARRYTVENMVHNVAGGVCQFLQSKAVDRETGT